MARPADPNAHESLLKAARGEFARHGIDRARVEDIAKAAGLSKGAFYLHFDSKQEAFSELLHRLIGILEELAARRREQHESFECAHGAITPDDIIKGTPNFLAAMEMEQRSDVELLEVLWRHREIVTALDSSAGEAHRDVIEAFLRRIQFQVIGDIKLKQEQGRIRADVDPLALVDIVMGAYGSFMHRLRTMKEKPDLAAWARSLMIVITQGILPSETAHAIRQARSKAG